MKNPFIILLHLGYWLLFVLLSGLFFSVATLQIRRTGSLSIAIWPLPVLGLVPNLFAFYSSYLYLFDFFLRARKFVFTFLAGVLICLLSTLFALALSVLFFGFEQPVFSSGVEFSALFFSFFLIAALHSGMALIIRGFLAWFEEIKLKEELARKNYETEIALLKSQINPHFLFNTINNIDVLITKDATRASQYLNKFSDLLRYLVYETKTEEIPLADELGYLEKYLELQKIRTNNPDYVNLFIDGEPKNLRIAPMIFFPFIENAFKHTENNKKSNTIKVRISVLERTINFECENTYQKNPVRGQDYGGLGNKLIRRRLELLYPEKHRLEITDLAGVYRINLTIYED
jgi:two-component system, LytTR family, sensor kinase